MSRSKAPSDRQGRLVEQLAGFRIGVTSDRRSEDLISALERRGADVLHAPALKIAPNDQDTALVEETRALIEARPEVVLVTTGYGMRRWFEVADATGLGAQLSEVLESARILARGPKAVGAVRAAGLEEVQVSASETTASLVDAVETSGLTGRRVAIQLHGYTDEVQLARLRDLSAAVWTVTPYRWVQPTAQDKLPKLIEATCARQLDALTFTSAPGAEATLAVARELGRLGDFVDALRNDVLAAAVGPVTAGPLRDAGAAVLMPDRYRLGASDPAGHRGARPAPGAAAAERQHRARAARPGRRRERSAGQARPELAGPVQGAGAHRQRGPASRSPTVSARGADDHALEVAMSRLRQALGVPGLVTTIVKRGYRLNAVRS